jgi:hypothetical protein
MRAGALAPGTENAMLEINLLPVEYRPREHTPYPRFVAIVAGISLVMVELFLIAHFKLNKINKGKEDNEAMRTKIDTELVPESKKTLDLDEKKKLFEAQVKEVRELEKDKVFFYTELQAIYQTMPQSAWVSKKLEIQKAKLQGGKEQIQLAMDVMLASDAPADADKYIRIIKEQPEQKKRYYSVFLTELGGRAEYNDSKVRPAPTEIKAIKPGLESVVEFNVKAWSAELGSKKAAP